MYNNVNFSATLKLYLKNEELSTNSFAKLIGVHPSTINNYITGKSYPKPSIMKKIANILNIEDFSNDTLSNNLSFSDELKLLLAKNFLTQYECSSLIGISQSLFSQYMLGKTLPELRIIIKIEKIFSTNLEKFYPKVSFKTEFGKRLYYLLAKNNMSRSSFARSLDISPNIIGYYIYEESFPSICTLKKMENLLGPYLKDVHPKFQNLTYVGKIILNYLYENELTEVQFSNKLGITLSTISKYIQGKSIPNMCTLQKIERFVHNS